MCIAMQVRRALHDAKAKLKEFGGRGAGPQARPPALSSAAASRFAQPPSMPAGTERAPGTTAARQALLELASEARQHPFRDGQPPPPPPFRAGQPPPPPPPRIPPGPPGAQAPAAVRTSSQPGVRPYLQPYQPPPGGIQGPQGPFRQPYPQQTPQEPYRQPYPGGLSPYRPVAGGRGVGPAAGRGPAARSLYTGPGQGSTSGKDIDSLNTTTTCLSNQGACCHQMCPVGLTVRIIFDTVLVTLVTPKRHKLKLCVLPRCMAA